MPVSQMNDIVIGTHSGPEHHELLTLRQEKQFRAE